MSLDGYIAGLNGESDWIVIDPEFDFEAMSARFDTYLIGRKTFDAMGRTMSNNIRFAGIRTILFSRTLKQSDYPHITVSPDAEHVVAELRRLPGKDIALFGGGELFRSLLAAGLVDRVEVAVMPVLLGAGIPLLPPPAGRAALKLRKQRVFKKTGTIGLEYDILRR
jgi:dihydrofolate reductase